MRLIDADALKEQIAETVEAEGKIDLKWSKGLNYSLKMIDNAQTVPNEYMRGYEAAEREYKRPQGKWIRKVDEVGFISHICSECGAEIEVEDPKDDKFCFNCGAKMKEAENDRDCEHCAHYVKAGLDWFCCESWECEFKPKGDEKND